MSWLETLKTGWMAIRSHRMRGFLTALGILIGVAAVILTVGLGEGSEAQVNSAIAALGSNLLIVSPGSTTSGGVAGGFGSASTLTLADAQAIGTKADCPNVLAETPVVTRTAVLSAGTATWTTPLNGSLPSYLSVRDRTMAGGSFITNADVTNQAHVVVLGEEVVSELFPGEEPLDQTVNIDGISFQVIGVLTSAGSSSSTNEDDLAILPITTLQHQLSGGGSNPDSVSDVYLEAGSSSQLSAAYQEVDELLLARHGITSPADADFSITSQSTIESTATSVSRTLTVLLAGVAAISLLVGGIGVMNIMLVSVTERFREIGLRKALGATPAVIRRQFLLEALMLGLAGGVAGVGLGLLGAVILPHFISNQITISWLAVGGSVLVAAGIGVVFGTYPASRAARLAPIVALRSE